jgi:TP901 family phage tail tape measure protein
VVVQVADRTTKVTLVAQVSGYIAGMEQAAAYTTYVGTEAERAAKKLAAQQQAFANTGRALLAFGAIAAAAVGIAVKKFADFDSAMSSVKAVTQATADEMALLREAALDAGGRTIYTATEAANALEELGKASFDTNTAIAALDGTLDLAAAGELEVARAAEIAATTLKQFGLEGSDAAHVADVLAAGAGKALGSVEDLAQALKFVGPVAASMGVSLEETTGALALFADQGIIGEQAGTALRGVLSSLTSPSSAAAKKIEELGISLYDSEGAFLGLENVAGQLSGAFTTLDDQSRDAALGVIFGNAQVTAARVLFDKGAEAVAAYTAEVNDIGYATRIAEDRLDNLAGDVEKLGGAFDTYLIKSGSGANEILRYLAQGATIAVDAVGSLPTPVLGAGLAFGAITAAVALAGGGFLTIVPKIAAAKIAMSTMGLTVGSVARSFALGGGAIAAAGLTLAVFAARAASAAATTRELKNTLDPLTGAVTEGTRAWVAMTVAEDDWISRSAKDIGVTQKEITDALLEGGDAYDDLRRRFTEKNNVVDFFNGSGVAAANAGNKLDELARGLINAKEQLEEQENSAGTATDAYRDAASQVAALDDELNNLIATINKANGVGQDAVSTNAAYRQTYADVTEAVNEFIAAEGASSAAIDRSTTTGSANADMFANLAAKSQAAAEAQFDLDNNSQAYLDNLNAGRQALYDQIFAITGNTEATQELIDTIYALPTMAEVEVLAETAEAQRRLDAINSSLAKFRDSSYGINISGYIRSLENENGGLYEGGVQAFASGGFPTGIYAGRRGGIHKFAEENVGWEAYISGKPGMEDRNRYIALEALGRLGVPSSSSVSTSTDRRVQVDMQVISSDPYVTGELVKQQLAAKLATLG